MATWSVGGVTMVPDKFQPAQEYFSPKKFKRRRQSGEDRSNVAISLGRKDRQRHNPKPQYVQRGISQQSKLVALLRFTINREQDYPSAPNLRKRFKAIETAAQLLESELTDLRITALLCDDAVSVESIAALQSGLRIVAARAATVLRQNPPKQGRRKLYPRSARGPTARELCALIVGFYWLKKRDAWPGKDDQTAQKICHCLWKKAGGATSTHYGKLHTGWRDHLKAAKRFTNTPVGQYLRSIFETTTAGEE